MNVRPIALAGLAIIAFTSTAAAQQLKPGTWTGTIAPPDNPPTAVTYDVVVSGDTTRITIKSPEFGSFPASNVKVAADRVTFDFEPGTPVHCTLLLRDDKSYSGQCVDSEGVPGTLVMIPPAMESAIPGTAPQDRERR